MKLPKQKYDIIVIDPPWQLDKIKKRVRPNQINMDYNMMSIKDIKKLSINKIAKSKCVLFLWTIDKYLFKSREILEGWGFKYHLTMVWNKTNGLAMFGFNRQTEFILVGFKGKHDAYPKTKTIRTCFTAKSKRHSEKPDVFYEMIRHLQGKKIDIFARKRHYGFDAWGDEVEEEIQNVLEESF